MLHRDAGEAEHGHDDAGEGDACNLSLPPMYQVACHEGLYCRYSSPMPGAAGVCTKDEGYESYADIVSAEGKWGDIMDCLSEGCEQKLEGCYADETCETIFDATASEREPTDAELSESPALKKLFSCYLSECKGKDSEGLAIKVDSFFGSNGNGNNKDKVDCYEECAGATGYDDDFPSSGK